MHRAQYLAAIAVVIIIVVAVAIRKKKRMDQYEISSTTGVWDSGAPGSYTCPETLAHDWCVLPVAEAVDKCAADPKCLGYVEPGPGSGWPKMFPQAKTPVQLVATTPAPNARYPGSTYHVKRT